MKKLRDGIRDFEKAALVEALRAGKTWEEAKEILPDVDPQVLDAGFKEWAHGAAGRYLELVAAPVAAPALPDGVEGVTGEELHEAIDEHIDAGGAVALEPADEPKPARTPRVRKQRP